MDDTTQKNHQDKISLTNPLENWNKTGFPKDFPIQITDLPWQALESFPTELPDNNDLETEVAPTDQTNNPSIPYLYFLRDDLLPLGLGTKWRKVQGILVFLNENQIRKVLLWGSIHGNYLASFAYILRQYGLEIECIAYSRDPQLKTYNEQMVRGHSHSIECYANRREAYAAWLEKQNGYPGLTLPEFGIHPSQILGLKSFWEKLKLEMEKLSGSLPSHEPRNNDRKRRPLEDQINPSQTKQETSKFTAILVLEIGSGATFLSAMDAYWGSSILVLGVMVGEPKAKWTLKVKDLQTELGLRTIPIPLEQILELPTLDGRPIPRTPNQVMDSIPVDHSDGDSSPDPKVLPKTNQKSASFAKKNQALNNWIASFYRNTRILLEPVYSGNTVYSLLREIHEMRLSFQVRGEQSRTETNIESEFFPNKFLKRSPSGEMIPIFYLHQGGQIQHLHLVFDRN
ncbi:hypothetical protein [Leptospira wolbachii]|nr:hypothetical protein [Leptospira wolbachii]